MKTCVVGIAFGLVLLACKNNGNQIRVSNAEPKVQGKPRASTDAPNSPKSTLRITVNIPAFRLVLWQNEKKIKSYEIGVARKKFPLATGPRRASQLIWNPDWIPPNSDWVDKMKGVEPGERIKSSDPRNPLGKLKIPLGDAYLIHQASKASDIGNLTSHGCVRMRAPDLLDLADRIVATLSISATKTQEIKFAKKSKKTTTVKVEPPLPVDISYETIVIEDNKLHLYPDVYDRVENPVQNLRSKLQGTGVSTAMVGDKALRQMLHRANKAQEFIVKVDDIIAGRSLTAGYNKPLTGQSAGQKQVHRIGQVEVRQRNRPSSGLPGF